MQLLKLYANKNWWKYHMLQTIQPSMKCKWNPVAKGNNQKMKTRTRWERDCKKKIQTEFKYSRILLTGNHMTGPVPDYQTFQTTNSTYTDQRSYRQFFISAPVLGLYNQSEAYSIWYLLQLLVQGCHGPFLFFLESLLLLSGCWRTMRLWSRSLRSWRSWWSRRQGVRR
jgi:hypothetical protein